MTREGVPERVLDPASTWEGPEAYTGRYRQLAARFIGSFRKLADGCPREVVESGPVR